MPESPRWASEFPAIPILLDGRNAAFVETFGMTEHAVPIDPASVALALERIALALGEGRSLWGPVFARRDALRRVMNEFVATALSTTRAAAGQR